MKSQLGRSAFLYALMATTVSACSAPGTQVVSASTAGSRSSNTRSVRGVDRQLFERAFKGDLSATVELSRLDHPNAIPPGTTLYRIPSDDCISSATRQDGGHIAVKGCYKIVFVHPGHKPPPEVARSVGSYVAR